MTIPAIPNPAVRTTANQAEAFMAALIGRSPSFPIHAYGHSYTAIAAFHSTGNQYLDLLKSEVNAGTVTRYGIGGSRIVNVLSALVNETALLNTVVAPISGSKWPGVTSRTGLTVFDISFNDVGHYPDMSAATALPAAITTSNSKYVDGVSNMWRLALAIMSSESRIEQNGTGTTFNGAGWTQASPNTYSSGGTVAFTSTVGNYWELSVTPPQHGPLAGKVFIGSYKLDVALGTSSAVTVAVDGTPVTDMNPYTPTAWEQYLGPGGSNIQLVWDCIPVTLPVDGAAHTIRLTHAGSAGHLLYVDAAYIPSTEPNPILVMDATTPPNVHASVWNSTQVGYWKQNYARLTPYLQEVVAEFPHAIWVPSTMTSNGIYSGDGIHPNDRGMRQRAGDAAVALREVLPRLRSRALQQEPNSSFGVI